ncbi:hypothetical protein C8D93_10353 [Sinimarinibacterium flocculans]|uniref:Uncharacterized protein n=1 Tax=Sinimarinibacterium flocculans TaxID=985250 RepID=A0A318EJQ2_9GAMM|nr:hypothetical protein C8D93_10353 [Sinimarinibacterium flocculans]
MKATTCKLLICLSLLLCGVDAQAWTGLADATVRAAG